MAMPEFLKKKIGATDSSSSSGDSSSSEDSSSSSTATGGDPKKVGTAHPDNPLMKWAAKRGQ